jgi:hypothetical protein
VQGGGEAKILVSAKVYVTATAVASHGAAKNAATQVKIKATQGTNGYKSGASPHPDSVGPGLANLLLVAQGGLSGRKIEGKPLIKKWQNCGFIIFGSTGRNQ